MLVLRVYFVVALLVLQFFYWVSEETVFSFGKGKKKKNKYVPTNGSLNPSKLKWLHLRTLLLVRCDAFQGLDIPKPGSYPIISKAVSWPWVTPTANSYKRQQSAQSSTQFTLSSVNAFFLRASVNFVFYFCVCAVSTAGVILHIPNPILWEQIPAWLKCLLMKGMPQIHRYSLTYTFQTATTSPVKSLH